MPSIHDSLLTGYVVDGKNGTITLHTEPHAGGGEAFIDVIFNGVAAYHVEHDCLQNIVFGIDEVPADAIVGDGVEFAERNRYGWPAGWGARTETAQQFFDRIGVRLFRLDCSYGMTGWFAAQSMEQQTITR